MRFLQIVAVTTAFALPCRADQFDDLLATYGNLQTVAGTALVDGGGDNGWQFAMEGGDGLDAELSRPHMTMADVLGNLYIADKDAHAIRRLDPDGTIHTIAGTNTPGFNGDGIATEVQLNQPNGLFTFPDGTTYILELANNRIRKLTTDGQIITVVHDTSGIAIGRGLWVNADQSLIYYSSGTEVKRWTAAEGITVVADGFQQLGNLHVNPRDGYLAVTDRFDHAVFEIFPDGSKQQVAGNNTKSGGGTGRLALSTGLNEVRAVFFNPTGGYFLGTHRDSQIWFVDNDDTIHLLIDGDRSNDTHAGDDQPLSTPGEKISEPRAVVLSPTGDLIITENDGGYIRFVEKLSTGIPGDIDNNQLVEANDIDLLSVAVRLNATSDRFDMDGSDTVDGQDRGFWIANHGNTLEGDADLNGHVVFSDFTALANHFNRLGGWTDGDFDGDGTIAFADFILLANNFGKSTAVAVPEPSCVSVLLSAVVLLVPMSKKTHGV